MTIDLIGGTGLFDRLGSLAKTINDLQTNWHDALETRLEDLMAETTTTQQRESAALMGRLRELQLNGKPTFDAFFDTARAIVIQMADDDAPLGELTIEAALAELLEQMESNNKGLAHTEPGSQQATKTIAHRISILLFLSRSAVSFRTNTSATVY
ncbi:MAG: hypothetical protein IIC02_05515 [Planctomycetes bacterium]|nr:hypothetical protein [Planctomycetota bacterium]